MSKNRKIFLISALILLLITLTAINATDINSNDTSDVKKITTASQTQNNVEKITNNPTKKEITKKEKTTNTKTTSSTVTATSYNDLYNKITTNTADTLTVNLNQNNQYIVTKQIPVINPIKTLTINGNGAKLTGSNNGTRFLYIDSSKKVILNNLEISNLGNGSINGGAIYSKGDLTTNICTFENCVSISGGAIKSDAGSLNIKNSYFTNNSAVGTGEAGCGGAIFQYKNLTMNIAGSTFTSNHAKNMGGAILQRENSVMNLSDVEFMKNQANAAGAIAQNANSTLNSNGVLFDSNNAVTDAGGAIWNYGKNSTYNLSMNTFFNNTAKNCGGAIKLAKESNIIIDDSDFEKNAASLASVIYVSPNSTVDIKSTDFEENNAVNSVIYNNDSDVSITKSNFINNTVQNGFVLDLKEGKIVKVQDSKFYNHTNIKGDVLFSDAQNDTKLAISGNTYKNNNLNISIIPPEDITVINDSTKDIHFVVDTQVRDIYNTTITDGKIIVSAIDNYIGEFDVVNGSATVKFNRSQLKEKINNITLTYFNEAGEQNYQQKVARFTVLLSSTNLTVEPIKGVIGESISLIAHVRDMSGNNISGGNLVFKLNGKTLREDGRFDSDAPALKFKVKDGLVKYNITADLYLRNTKNLTASYSGTSTYDESRSETVTAQIQKRYASITVNATPTVAKQYESIQFVAEVSDVTKNAKNKTLINYETYVMFKVNGVTLKDQNGTAIQVKVDKNNIASYNYIIPAGTGGIDSTGTVRNYSVTAVFVGENYYPDVKNTTYFNVERSNVTVNFDNVTVSKDNKLNVKAVLKDYMDNNVLGTSKVLIKVNGKSLRNETSGKAFYFNVKDGVVDLSGIQVDANTTIKRVMLVVGERQAYFESRNETKEIIRI